MSYLKHRGRVIRDYVDAEGGHSGRWLVQTYHYPTGNPWADELCPHYQTLKAARESIREDLEADMEPTYREMTTDDLGDMATEQDLQDFSSACAAYQEQTGASDQEAMDYIWGDGDWLPRALEADKS